MTMFHRLVARPMALSSQFEMLVDGHLDGLEAAIMFHSLVIQFVTFVDGHLDGFEVAIMFHSLVIQFVTFVDGLWDGSGTATFHSLAIP